MRMQAVGAASFCLAMSFDFAPSKPKFAIKAKLDKVDLHEIISFKSNDLAKSCKGTARWTCRQTGKGCAGKTLRRGFWDSSTWALPRQAGHGQAGIAGRRPAYAAAGAVRSERRRARDVDENLTAQFKISDGRLRTNNPIRYQTEQGAIQLTGSIGLDKTLDLLGDCSFSRRSSRL